MRSARRWAAVASGTLGVAAVGAVASMATAQGAPTPSDSVSSPITGVAYEVTFDRAAAARGMVAVTMSFTTAGTRPVLLSLPAWTPGAYEISNFAHSVVGFDATSAGSPIAWDKVDHDTWRIRSSTANRQISVRFGYLSDSLDNAKLWVQPDFALFNGTNLFLYPEGQSPGFAATVSIKTEVEWLIATGMKREGNGRYSAANYHDLVDMPFFIGKFDLDSTQISGKWVRFASYPAGSVAGARRDTVWSQLRRVIPPQVAVFGEAPWDAYTVMQIIDSTYGGASGLEHQNSHVDVLSPGFVGSDFQPSLYAHEIFHAWNVKRLRPAELWPYVYSRTQPTPWLWVSEGITDYYADLALVRGRVIDEEEFYATTAGKINEVNAAPPTALEDASLSTWVQPADGTGYLYYAKGSLAGLLLDIIIRDASDNARSLDTVMRELYETTYKQGRGFQGSEFWGSVVKAAGGKSFGSFNARFIDGRDPLPLDSILPLAGLRIVQARVPRLGVFSQADQYGVMVTAVDPAGAAASAGIRAGDYLLTVGDIPVQDQLFGERFRAKYASAAEGSPLPIRIRRTGQEQLVQAQLRFAPGDVRVEPNPAAGPKAVRIRNAILGRV